MGRNGNDNGHSLPRLPFEDEEDAVFDLTDDIPFAEIDDIPLTGGPGVMNSTPEVEAATAHVSAVFGEPLVVGDKTIIPVASVRRVFGFRGGWTSAAPVAVIEVGEDGVNIRSLNTPVLIPLAGILLVAWNVYWVMRMIRDGRAKRSE